jgi:hypothetical protein
VHDLEAALRPTEPFEQVARRRDIDPHAGTVTSFPIDQAREAVQSFGERRHEAVEEERQHCLAVDNGGLKPGGHIDCPQRCSRSRCGFCIVAGFTRQTEFRGA